MKQPDILLCTLNAKYIHTAFGLRSLLANLGEMRPRAALLEFDLAVRPLDIVERLLAQAPRIVGFGVYIWNVTATTEVLAVLKRLDPELTVVLGGPEVSCENDLPPVAAFADYIITGEAEFEFAALCRAILSGTTPPAAVNVPAPRSPPPAHRSPLAAHSARPPPRRSFGPHRRVWPALRCRTNSTPTPTSRTGSCMSSPRAAVRSAASFVCRHWTRR